MLQPFLRVFVLLGLSGLLLGGVAECALAQAPNFNWRSVGPNNLGGRTRAIEVGPDGQVWAGNSGGGLWVSDTNRTTWNPVQSYNQPDDQFDPANQCVSTIEIDPARPETILVGTGDLPYFFQFEADIPTINTTNYNYPGQYGCFGSGVFVSTDGGQTWDNNNATGDVVVDPFNVDNGFISIQDIAIRGDRVFMATLSGFYFSDDLLQSTILATDQTGRTTPQQESLFFDIELGVNDRVFAATANGVYLSEDNGATFSRYLTRDTFPRDPNDPQALGTQARMEVAVAPSDPNFVYVLEVDGNGFMRGVWQSRDGGDSWVQIGPRSTLIGATNPAFAPLGGDGIYATVLEVDPSNPERLFLAGERTYVYEPEKGWFSEYSTFQSFVGVPDYIPEGVLSASFDPNNPSRLYLASDRGIVRTDDNGETFQLVVGGMTAQHTYSVTQQTNRFLYGIADQNGFVRNINPSGVRNFSIEGSNQDRGLIIRSLYNDRHLILSQPFGTVLRSVNSGENFETFEGFPNEGAPCTARQTDTFPNTSPALTQFYTPVVLDELVDTLQIADTLGRALNTSYLFISRGNNVWVVYNPFGGNDSLPTWTRITCNSLDGEVTAMATDHTREHTLFVGTSQGDLYRIRNAQDVANATVEDITGPNMPNRFISMLEVSPHDPNVLLVGYGSFRSSTNPDNQNLLLSVNAQDPQPTYQEGFDAGLPPNLPVYSAFFDPVNDSGYVVLGTQRGIWGTSDFFTNPNFTEMVGDGEMPRVPVYNFFFKQYELRERQFTLVDTIVPDSLNPGEFDTTFVDFTAPVLRLDPNNRLLAATYGRGIFESLDSPLSVDEEGLVEARHAEQTTLAVFPNPARQQVTLSWEQATASQAQVALYSVQGRLVRQWPAQQLAPGQQQLKLQLEDLPGGVYLIQAELQTQQGAARLSNKLILAR